MLYTIAVILLSAMVTSDSSVDRPWHIVHVLVGRRSDARLRSPTAVVTLE